VGFVVSVSGAAFGSILMFIVPAIMNINNIKAAAKGKELQSGEKTEIAANYGLIGLGGLMGVLGVAVSTLKQLGKL